MYKENILTFISSQSVEVSNVVNNEIKKERRSGNVSKWFNERDTIEFDDSAESFLKVNTSGNILETIKQLNVNVYRDGVKVDLKKESFHCVAEIAMCVASFFIFRS